jgi:hypothetical protein
MPEAAAAHRLAASDHRMAAQQYGEAAAYTTSHRDISGGNSYANAVWDQANRYGAQAAKSTRSAPSLNRVKAATGKFGRSAPSLNRVKAATGKFGRNIVREMKRTAGKAL